MDGSIGGCYVVFRDDFVACSRDGLFALCVYFCCLDRSRCGLVGKVYLQKVIACPVVLFAYFEIDRFVRSR